MLKPSSMNAGWTTFPNQRTQYPAQVQVEVYNQCPSLAERSEGTQLCCTIWGTLLATLPIAHVFTAVWRVCAQYVLLLKLLKTHTAGNFGLSSRTATLRTPAKAQGCVLSSNEVKPRTCAACSIQLLLE